MIRNKKGFTLVELLAVIVVLAIIIIIALPNVINAMNRAKEGSFKIYAKRAISDAQSSYQADELMGNGGGACYTIATIGLGANGKYTGWVDTTGADYKVYITDGTFVIPGLTINQIDALTSVTSGSSAGTVPAGCK